MTCSISMLAGRWLKRCNQKHIMQHTFVHALIKNHGIQHVKINGGFILYLVLNQLFEDITCIKMLGRAV